MVRLRITNPRGPLFLQQFITFMQLPFFVMESKIERNGLNCSCFEENFLFPVKRDNFPLKFVLLENGPKIFFKGQKFQSRWFLFFPVFGSW